MDIIYWITIFDSIKITAGIISFLSLFGLVFLWMNFIEDKTLGNLILSIFVSFLFFLNVTICAFLPSTKNAFIIYGLGNTIEYIKNNDTAKQLPDKAIKCLDMLMDEYIEKDNPKNDE